MSILLEPCLVRTLFEFHQVMIRDRIYITNATMWNIFQQLAHAIACLHEGMSPKKLGGVEDWKPVIHRDIRTQNKFISALLKSNDWKTMRIKLGDFGVASEPGSKPEAMSDYVTTLYRAPEVEWKEPKLTDKSDVWAVGAIIHELAHGVGTTCNPKTLEERWKEKYRKLPDLDWADEKGKRNYWAAHAPRIVMGTQMETGEDKEFRFQVDPDARRLREMKVITGYTEDLDHCMKSALNMRAEERHDAYRC
jgi:serine/threonine protein kinase